MAKFYTQKVGEALIIKGPEVSIEVFVSEVHGSKRNRSAIVEVSIRDNSTLVELVENSTLIPIYPEVLIGILPYPNRRGRHPGDGVTIYYKAPKGYRFEKIN